MRERMLKSAESVHEGVWNARGLRGRRGTGSWEAAEGVFCAKRGTSRSFLFHLTQKGSIRPGEMVRIFRFE